MNLGSPIAKGNTAEIYLCKDCIVKVFNDCLPDTESSYEADKQTYAYSCGLAVPKVFDVTKINGKQAIVMEYIKGKTLGELLLEDRENAEYYLSLSVDIQQKLHQIIPDNLESMQEKLQHQIERSPLVGKWNKNYLIKKLHALTYENRLCHGDFHLFNLIMTDTGVSIIYWVDSTAGDIRADIYRSYLLYSQFSAELAEMYLQIYCEKSGLLKTEILQWAPIIAGARSAEGVSSGNSKLLLDIIHHYSPIKDYNWEVRL
ncbi:aminoglycoside phosphotransferase family protein [Gracilibacillus oryzae]|uniref:Aminoglycoside phosphotransferase family protein n=1 Tax=Gracilibacillus oryzae TaxID=1672701 RepID=A0A7C8GUM6_9BACI|nr:aminoglycoside phosphotransferase family protein [Gracilibacillus oryzae]KAB8138116.1 aminoglycoside phosphotransferase family protein [Gracilibacillus oryzae]